MNLTPIFITAFLALGGYLIDGGHGAVVGALAGCGFVLTATFLT